MEAWGGIEIEGSDLTSWLGPFLACGWWDTVSNKREDGRWAGANELLSTLLPEVGTPELALSFHNGREGRHCEIRGKQSSLLSWKPQSRVILQIRKSGLATALEEVSSGSPFVQKVLRAVRTALQPPLSISLLTGEKNWLVIRSCFSLKLLLRTFDPWTSVPTTLLVCSGLSLPALADSFP